MKTAFFGVSLALALTGCSQQEETAETSLTNNSSGNPLTAPADYLGAVNKAQKAAVRTVDLASLKSAIQLYYANEGQYPKSLNDLAAEKYIPAIPEPPQGSSFSYDPKTGELKLLRQ